MIKLDGLEIHPTIFPDKTSQVWHLPYEAFETRKFELDWTYQIDWEFENESELIHIAQLKQLIDSERGVNSGVQLNMPYLPYARQDKATSNHTTFAFHTFAKIINSMEFNKITCIDPHNTSADCWIKNLYCEYPTELIKRTMKETSSCLVCYPDKGASDKYDNVYSFPAVHGNKVRDQDTGFISHYELLHKDIVRGRNVLIVDDICDGGMTFIILTKALLDAGATEVNLFVTHGIFSKGLQIIGQSGIKRIYTMKGKSYDSSDSI